jgi:hypothetical protein
MGYFDLKKQIQSSPKTSSKSSYFALKQKALPIIESNMLRRQEEEKRKRYEDAVRNAEIAKQQATKAGGFMGLAKETAKGVGKTLLDFGKEAVRFPLTVPLKVVQSLTEGFTGKPQIYTPETKVEKFLYGAEPRQSYQQDQSSIAKFAQEKGLGKGASVALGTAGAAAETVADLALPGVASKVFKSAVGKSILSRLGVKSAKLEEAVLKGTTTEKEIIDIFENKGIKGVEEIVSDKRVLEAGEVPKVVKEIETKSGRKLNVKEILQVNDDLKKGISKETIIDELAPEAPKMPVEPIKPKVEVKTPVKEKVDTEPLIQEAKYKTTVNIQDKNDLEYLRRILSEDNIKDIQSGKMVNFRGTPYEDIAKVNLISETPKTMEQQLAGKIKEVKLKSDTFYHGTSAENARGIMETGFKRGSELPEETFRGGGYGKMQSSISLTETPKDASRFSTLTKNGEIVEAKLKPNSKVVSIDGVEDAVELEDYISYLKKQKVDAVYIGGGEKELVVINPKAITPTKSQLTDIWNKSQPLQEGAKIEAPKIEPKLPEKGKSITAQKMNKRFADDKQMSTEYDVIEINKKLDEATKKLQENPEKAISEAFSEGGSNVDKIATLTELFEKSIKDGDEFMQKQAFNKLKQLAPETAQSLNMFKALTEANPHFSYMSSVVDEKLKNLVLSSSNLRKATKGMKPSEALNKAKKMAKEKITKDILNTKSKITIKKAQDLLDSLICK